MNTTACIATSLCLLSSLGCGESADVDDPPGHGDGSPPPPELGVDAGDDCAPPDLMMVLDRTLSMHRRPNGSIPNNSPEGYAESKWSIAITAIETVSASMDETVRFGLTLFPRDPGGGQCITLSQRIRDKTASNTRCEEGEIVVSPDLGVGADIATLLDPETTLLCRSTPVGAGVATGAVELDAVADGEREQYVMLITDGKDTCGDEATLEIVQALAARGVSTYAIAFDATGGVDPAHMNHISCAGRTAIGFPVGCVADAAGDYTAASPGGERLFMLAEDAAGLTAAIEEIAGNISCDPVVD